MTRRENGLEIRRSPPYGDSSPKRGIYAIKFQGKTYPV